VVGCGGRGGARGGRGLKPRSSHCCVITDRFFLQTPLPIVQTNKGFRVPERATDVTTHKFSSVFRALNLQVNNILYRSATTFPTIPYDLYCYHLPPQFQSVLTDRIRRTCRQYFVSMTMLLNHTATYKHHSVSTKVVRHLRVAARYFLFSKTNQASSENHRARYSVSTAVLSLGLKRPESATNHSLPFSYEIKNVQSLITTPLICVHGVDRDNFSFTS
jgi:hypothetical protein